MRFGLVNGGWIYKSIEKMKEERVLYRRAARWRWRAAPRTSHLARRCHRAVDKTDKDIKLKNLSSSGAGTLELTVSNNRDIAIFGRGTRKKHTKKNIQKQTAGKRVTTVATYWERPTPPLHRAVRSDNDGEIALQLLWR